RRRTLGARRRRLLLLGAGWRLLLRLLLAVGAVRRRLLRHDERTGLAGDCLRHCAEGGQAAAGSQNAAGENKPWSSGHVEFPWKASPNQRTDGHIGSARCRPGAPSPSRRRAALVIAAQPVDFRRRLPADIAVAHVLTHRLRGALARRTVAGAAAALEPDHIARLEAARLDRAPLRAVGPGRG